jgi:outer membrane protein TolC
MLTSCAVYRASPLTDHTTALSKTDLTRLTVNADQMPWPSLKTHRFDPSDGLDIDEVAMLAVANNPDLKLARDDVGIANAQAFSAGLLPDPQLGVSSDYAAIPGTTRAFNYGLSMDLLAVLSRAGNHRAAIAAAKKIDLGLLWQEWQVIALAKQLFLRSLLAQQSAPLLAQQVSLTQRRYEVMAKAQANGDLTRDSVTAALTAYTDARTAAATASRAAEQTHHDLNMLLGLAPDVRLPLIADVDPSAPGKAASTAFGQTAISDTTVTAALASLPQRRPDLMALRMGYDAQDQKYRTAIFNQFPALTVGFDRQRDTSNVYTSGFQITMSLPIFNRNRGNIAIEKSTRQRLKDEYAVRLNAAYADVVHMQADQRIMEANLAQAQAALPNIDQTARAADHAYAHHALTLTTYTDLNAAAVTKTLEVMTLSESLAEQRVGLEALLGENIQDSDSSAMPYSVGEHDPHVLTTASTASSRQEKTQQAQQAQ